MCIRETDVNEEKGGAGQELGNGFLDKKDEKLIENAERTDREGGDMDNM